MPNTKELKDWWQAHYGSATPLAYILRQQVPNRWFRIHSLPESKRYAETPDEYSILLTRHNTIATAVLGSQTRCLLLVGRYTEHAESDVHSQGLLPRSLPQLEGVSFTFFDSVQEIDLIGPGQESALISIWCAPVMWSAERFNDLIKAVADYQEANIMFASLTTGEIYAPYDGGADLFLSSTARRDELNQQYSRWLSDHPQGL
ncbi:MAG TPA: hypothetical protein VFT66_10565 [Roseiflexaceae bacterium]|jgi:hypothetical protein|nr:hypothetical protein [Roseiflexaceae bacterium]